MSPAASHEIRLCNAADGARIAWAAVGTGPPLVKSANWMTHLELDRTGPLWRHWFEAFAGGGRRFAAGMCTSCVPSSPPALRRDTLSYTQ